MVLKTTRRTPLWFSLAFVLLAVSIFGWGLGYKLSLYNASESSFHRAPSAKLLTGDETSTSEHAIANVDLSGPPPAEMQGWERVLESLAVWWLAALVVKQWELNTVRSAPGRRQAAFNSFFFRPPPQLAI